ETGLTRQQVNAVFESLKGIMRKSLRSHGLFTLPGMLKLKVVKKPATKAREGVNPVTGEKMIFKAKPASKKVRVLPLKNVKDMVSWFPVPGSGGTVGGAWPLPTGCGLPEANAFAETGAFGGRPGLRRDPGGGRNLPPGAGRCKRAERPRGSQPDQHHEP